MSCHEATELGAYVLGALDPAEREQVDAHLRVCPACAAELAEFQELPALLDRLEPADLDDLHAIAVPPSPDLFERVAAAVRTPVPPVVHRSRRWLMAAAAAAALAVLGGGTAVAIWAAQGGEPTFSAEAGQVRFSVTATAQQTGTALDVTVAGLPPGTECQLVVFDADGHRDDAGGWTVTYTGEGSFRGWTEVERAELTGVVLLGSDGEELVRLSMS